MRTTGRTEVPGTVYLLHFDSRYPNGRQPGHYLGWSEDLDSRIAEHRSGQGARLTQVIKESGITFEVVRTWDGTRKLERQLKNSHHHSRLCPTCQRGA